MIKIYSKMFLRALFLQALWNYERMQNIGLLFVLKPFLYKIYLSEDKRKEALLRHTGFFNTHPYMSNMIIIVIANMEKEIAKGNCSEKVSEVNMIKSVMEGPLAAIGDSFFWGTLRPLMALISIFILIILKAPDSRFTAYGVLVPLVFISLYNAVHILIRYRLIFMGFLFDKKNIANLSKLNFKFLWKMGRLGKVIIPITVLFLYLKVFGFGPESVSSGVNIQIIFKYSAVLVLSVLVSKKFGSVPLFYGVILTCIIMSYLGM